MKQAPKTPRMTPEQQSELFKKTAREMGADESPEAFERTLKRIAPQKPAPVSPAKTKP
ncbi:MAG: hypothetical protein AB7T07_01810 [Steroidobacteraceae bacterium]